MEKKIVIVANGEFPSSQHCLDIIANADIVVCCDGAITNLHKLGVMPHVIIGDLDSISSELRSRYSDIIIHNPDQSTNDLTKAVNYCSSQGFKCLAIVAATGLREDHSIANISLLAEYLDQGVVATIYSDHSHIQALESSQDIKSFLGQKVSFFALDNNTQLSSKGLVYEMDKLVLRNWWVASLNESMGDSFYLSFERGKKLIVISSY